MDTVGAPISEGRNTKAGNADGSAVEIEGLRHRVDDIISKVDKVSSRRKSIQQLIYSMLVSVRFQELFFFVLPDSNLACSIKLLKSSPQNQPFIF